MKKKKINCTLTLEEWSMLYECLRFMHETLEDSPTTKVVERIEKKLDASTENV
tara:strand:+ start:2168 stop:2326 length:159 start_codon:yes stop_codon:yes gene_type:complete